MPYIKQSDRNRITTVDSHSQYYKSKNIKYESIDTAGELQYAIAVMIKSFMERKGLNYQNCNDVMGALAGAQQEFYRRTVAPYEDKKIEENGDV